MEISREDHMAWCKRRALEYVERGSPMEAMASMFSDLKRHPETADHAAIPLGMGMMMMGKLSTPGEARKFIEGFN